MSKADRRVAVFIADTHAGHRLGLMRPGVQLLDDSGPEARTWTPATSAVQEWLWGCYTADMADALAIAGRSPVTLVHNGDLTWGTRFASQLVSTRLADQLIIGAENLAPWYEQRNTRSVVLIEGTESHEFGEGSAAVALAAEMGRRYPKVSTICTRHGNLSIDGVHIDTAHHGPTPGTRTWLAGNELRYYVRSILMGEVMRGNRPPDAVIRAHHHVGLHETVRQNGYTIEGWVLPAYAGMTHHSQQATRSAYRLSCGMLVLVIEDGRIAESHELWRELDLRQEVAV